MNDPIKRANTVLTTAPLILRITAAVKSSLASNRLIISSKIIVTMGHTQAP
jgi:hypothetical protein